MGTNPLIPEGAVDGDDDGLPDWLERSLGGDVGPWDDSDGDRVPNIVEFEIGSNPAYPDYGAAFPSPAVVYPQDKDAPRAECTIIELTNVPYSEADGPAENPYFPTVAFSLGPLGTAVAMAVRPSDYLGAGSADVKFWIMPSQALYYFVYPFSEDGNPLELELQRPESADGVSYRNLLLNVTKFTAPAAGFADTAWSQIKEPVLQLLRKRTLEYLSATVKMRIAYYCRDIQWLEYTKLKLGSVPGIEMRIRRRLSIIHTEFTKLVAINIRSAVYYPNAFDYVGKIIRFVEWLSFACNLPDELRQLWEDYLVPYFEDVRDRRSTTAAMLLSLKIQELFNSIPNLLPIPTADPIFWPCPLGLYEGGDATPQDCLKGYPYQWW